MNEAMEALKSAECSSFNGLLRASKYILKDNSLNRLRMIGILHDFEHIDEYFENEVWEASASNSEAVNYDQLVQSAFFPALNMKFTKRENPLQIVSAIDKQVRKLRMEMLLFQQNISKASLDKNKKSALGCYMERSLRTLNFEQQSLRQGDLE